MAYRITWKEIAIMSTLFEELEVSYREEDGLFYPNISMDEEKPDIITGKYGDLWMRFMKENCPERYRHFIRLGELRMRASEVNEDAYEMLYGIMAAFLATHVVNVPKSTLENWTVSDQATQMAEEIVLLEIVYCYHYSEREEQL